MHRTKNKRENKKINESFSFPPPALGQVHTQSHTNLVFLPVWFQAALGVLAFVELLLIDVGVKEGLGL